MAFRLLQRLSYDVYSHLEQMPPTFSVFLPSTFSYHITKYDLKSKTY